MATTIACGTAMTTQASSAALSTPSRTGSEPMPIRCVALDRLEIIERHDPVRADAVERGEDDDAPIRQRRRHHGGAGEPRQPLVAGPTAALPHQPLRLSRNGGAL